MIEPTDQELDALLGEHWPAFATSGARPLKGMRAAIRDAIAQWGTPPAVAGEPFCYVSVNKQGDITRTMKRKDKWTNIPLYTTPQTTQAQAGAVPLTDEQIRAMCKESWVFETVKQWVRITEQHHGIKGGQHAD